MLFICSCEEEAAFNLGLAEGTYTGSFYRSCPSATYEFSSVTLHFNKNEFEGNSSIVKYPAICKGTYKVSGQEIEFVNECPWTAEFDWSFILSGSFTISSEGDKILISRSYGEGISDTYVLTKQ